MLKVVVAVCLLWTVSAFSMSVERARALFLDAEHQVATMDRNAFQYYQAQLADYPLWPYLESAYYRNNLALEHKQAIQRLLTLFPDSPFSRPLQREWLSFLAEKQFRQAFIEQYKDTGDTALTCLYLTWQMQSGVPKDTVLQQVDEMWVTPYSAPKDCNYLFEQWQSSSYFEQSKVIKRIETAAKVKNYGLMQQLKGLLNEDNQYLVGLWKATTNHPSASLELSKYRYFNRYEADIFDYALRRVAFQFPNKVERAWTLAKDKFDFTQSERDDTMRIIGLAYAVNDAQDSLEWLMRIPDTAVDETIKQWRLGASLKQTDWHETLAIIDSLPIHLQLTDAALYWKARSLEQLNNQTEANAYYQELAERRDYYGFLAAERIGKEINLRDVPIAIQPQEYSRVAKNLSLQRAYELRELGRELDARKEWNRLPDELSEREMLVAAKLAYDWGWYDRPIFTLADIGYLNDVRLRFPLAYKGDVEYQSSKKQLSQSLIFAIARRESSFMQDAYSRAGAAGLMQLKPSTASFIAKSKVGKQKLFEPATNLNLATDYLSHLLNRAKQNPVIAIAAYNAGLAKVKTWLPKESMTADAWVETLPYRETRDYVKAVTAYSQVYQQLTGDSQNPVTGMTQIEIQPSL